MLERYRPAQYSWAEWMEADLNGSQARGVPDPDPSTGSITLRKDQAEDVRTILAAHAAGAPEFILGNDVGTGKTPTTVTAVKNLPGVRSVLIICPFSVMPVWRSHLRRMGDGGKRWAIINYESSKKLLEAPKSAHQAKRTRTKNLRIARDGKAKAGFDVVICDESHALGNPESQQTMVADKVVAGPNGKSAFVLRLSATAGSNPAQLSYLHRGIAWRTGNPVKSTISSEEYVKWCEDNGFKVSMGGYGNRLTWDRNGTDLSRMQMLLFKGEPLWGVRRKPPWDEPQRIPLPVELTPTERDTYEEEWAHFQAAMKQLEAARRASTSQAGTGQGGGVAKAQAKGRAAQVRYRQKVGQVKARGNARFAKDLIGKGLQVAISCEFIDTVNALHEALSGMGVDVAEFTGQNRATREEERIAFQRGEKPVIIFTPAEGFNLQANDGSVEGASSTPRATIVAEPRWSPKKALQIEGRCHRDHELAPVYYSYAESTVDEDVISAALAGMRDTKMLMGDSIEHFKGLSKALKVPLLLGD